MPYAMAKRTTVHLPQDFTATVKALLQTPSPPAGDPSTRKQKPKKLARKRATRKGR
jgi:hypothetical protein